MVLESEYNVSELVLESKEDDDSYSLFPTKLVESEEEEVEISISPLLKSSTTDFDFINDMVPTNTDTPSLEVSMGESYAEPRLVIKGVLARVNRAKAGHVVMSFLRALR
ncbi:protein required for mother cell-specific HO expression [Corchorus olitorius]|uniref:Protein required for mother cell-specific HO expression n=1 Tax=Corchorus olitorius TaxID=93759 RepID=A0A1R3JK06_9ROSI|nr:protein required for mother cell-specific HO expression [Corchorus olitorius]